MSRSTLPLFAVALAAVVLVGLETPAAQAARHPIGTFDDWQAYTATENGKKICYMGSTPAKAVGDYTKRGEVVFLVTHRPADKETGIVSVTAGYTYKKDSKVQMVVDDKTFDLFTDGGFAFAPEGKDPVLVQAMIRGSGMVIKGVSSRGTKTTDTYSLKGFTAAWKAIGKACGVK